jgi:thiol-disulfide isomerase/thioredoxin
LFNIKLISGDFMQHIRILPAFLFLFFCVASVANGQVATWSCPIEVQADKPPLHSASRELSIVVRNSHDQPASGIDLIYLSGQGSAFSWNGSTIHDVSYYPLRDGKREPFAPVEVLKGVTNRSGSFTFKRASTMGIVIAQGSDGYALATTKAGDNLTMSLHSWCTVEGHSDAILGNLGTPVSITSELIATEDVPMLRFEVSTYADAKGNFQFSKLPAGNARIRRVKAMTLESGEVREQCYDLARANVEPGTTKVQESIKGASVIGHLVGDQPLRWTDALGVLRTSIAPSKKRSATTQPLPGDNAMLQLRAARLVSSKAERDAASEIEISVNRSGQLKAVGVPPGRYSIELELFRRTSPGDSEGRLEGPVGFVRREVVIEPTAVKLDIGELNVIAKLQVGQAFPAFPPTVQAANREALKPIGRDVTIVYFWASWCGSCATDLEVLRSVDKEFGASHLSIVGCSLDSDPASRERYLRDHNIPWPQIRVPPQYMGAMRSMYGIDGIPSFVLVDSSLRVRAVNIRGSQIRDSLKELLEKK